MLQQQLMFKQLEELQRQQKLQGLNDSRQRNVLNQQSLIHNKQVPGAQYAPIINGTLVRDASQMFMLGNTNFVHGHQSGLPYSQAQNQVLRSVGLASPLVDGHNVSRFFHLQGATRESTSEQVDTIRNMFAVAPALSQTEIDQQEFGKGQEHDIINPSQEFTSLDPLERKFLFDTSDDNSGGFGNMFEDTDNVQAFPSLQSGSWSALMQSALEETSSTDTGVQEEWSGLSFQNPELPHDNTFQTAPSLKPSNGGSSFPGFQQSCKEAGEFEYVNDSLNNGKDLKKGFLTDNQRHSASDMTTFRSSDSSDMSALMDKTAGFPAPDLSSQTSRHMLLHTVNNREYKHGTQSAYTDSNRTSEMPKTGNTDAFAPSKNSSVPQYFGLLLGTPTQRPPLNYFDLSQISQQADTSRLVPLKDQEGQRSVIFEGPRVWPVTGTSSLATNQDMFVPRSKKRKFPTYELLPWHKEATKGSSRLQDMSTAEAEWAHAAKRVPEMLKEVAEALGDSNWLVHSKKKIILTTQLMQVLFRPAPAAILSDAASKCYNTLTYFAARLALGDACSLSNHFYKSCNTPDSLSEKSIISKCGGDQNLSKTVQDLINRATELENDLLRFENGGSILDIRMQSLDLERFSVINRFAKFHTRVQMAAAEAASSGGASTVPKLYPQRYVTASPMPMTVPQVYDCLSLGRVGLSNCPSF